MEPHGAFSWSQCSKDALYLWPDIESVMAVNETHLLFNFFSAVGGGRTTAQTVFFCEVAQRSFTKVGSLELPNSEQVRAFPALSPALSDGWFVTYEHDFQQNNYWIAGLELATGKTWSSPRFSSMPFTFLGAAP